MAEYQKSKESQNTKYNFKPTIDFPPTMQCIRMEELELQISPSEKAEILGEAEKVEE